MTAGRKVSAFFQTTALVLAVVCITSASLAAEPGRYTLGNTTLNLRGPVGHSWTNPKGYPPLALVPKRYKGLTRHVLGLYSTGSINSPSKIYNNHGALFFAGSAKKTWSADEFARIKAQLMPVQEPLSEDEVRERQGFFKTFLAERADFAVPGRKAKKYYQRLQQARVLYDSGNAVALAYRHKKKGEKDKYVTLSLSLVGDKLIGTAYYQVEPNRKERERAEQMTLAWQQVILNDNKTLKTIASGSAAQVPK